MEGKKVQLISVENVSHQMISDDQILPPGNLNLHFGPDGQLKCEHLQKVQLISVENVSHQMISDDQILPPGNLNLHFGPDGQLKCEHLQESTLIWASENFITWPGWTIE